MEMRLRSCFYLKKKSVLVVCTGYKNLYVLAEPENWVRDWVVGGSDRIKPRSKLKVTHEATDCSWYLWRQVMTAVVPLDELFTPSVILVLDLKQHKPDKLQPSWIIFTTVALLMLFQSTNYTKREALFFFNIFTHTPSAIFFFSIFNVKNMFKILATLGENVYTRHLSSQSFKL